MTFVLWVATVSLAFWAFALVRERSGLRAHHVILNERSAALQANNQALHQHSQAVMHQMHQVAAENQQLAKYRAIVNVEHVLERVIEETEEDLSAPAPKAASVAVTH